MAAESAPAAETADGTAEPDPPVNADGESRVVRPENPDEPTAEATATTPRDGSSPGPETISTARSAVREGASVVLTSPAPIGDDVTRTGGSTERSTSAEAAMRRGPLDLEVAKTNTTPRRASSVVGGTDVAPISSTTVGVAEGPAIANDGDVVDVDPTSSRTAGIGVGSHADRVDNASISGTNSTPIPTSQAASVASTTSAAAGAGTTVVPADFVAVSASPPPSMEAAAKRGQNRGGADRPSSGVGEVGRAAVSRAAAINEAVIQARAGDAPGPVGPSTSPSIVVPPMMSPSGIGVASGIVSNEAQGMPNSGAGVALDGAEGGPNRTIPGVARGLDALSQQKGGTLLMRLDPPSLGQVKLEMTMSAGRVAVLMTAAADTAQSLLRNNLGMLRQALEDRGLAVERLTVETVARPTESGSGTRSENRGDGQDARSGQDAEGRQDAGQGRSRGRREDASARQSDRETDSSRSETAEFVEALADAGVSEH